MKTLEADPIYSYCVRVPCSLQNELDFGVLASKELIATNESEAIALAFGLRLGGANVFAAIQNSGLANSLNTIGSLVISYEVPFPILVTVRGLVGDPNPAQAPIGQATVPLISALGCDILYAYSNGEVNRSLLSLSGRSVSRKVPPVVLYIPRWEQ